MGYVCTKCRFKYDKEGKVPQRCPYCSSVGTLKKAQTAQDLINDISEETEIIEESKKERGVK